MNPFAAMMNDTVSLHKKNGEIIEGIKASVQKNNIYIVSSDILIEHSDLIKRKMSNGGEQTYEVIDPGFIESAFGLPANYQMNVRLLGIPEAKKAEQTIINNYNVTGYNARINQNSVDSSINTVSINSNIKEHLDSLRKAIDKLKITSQEKVDANEIVDTIENNLQKGKPNKTLIKSLLKGLPVAVNIASIAGEIIACL